MLVNLRDMCAIAEQYNMAIGSFNTPNMESLRATIIAAEETHLPVMISHAQVHEPIAPLDLVGPAMVALAERSSALICVHLDHCEDLSYMRRALEMGFNGAMYDGSALPYQRNIENSQRAAAMCASFDCGLECEIGSLIRLPSLSRPRALTRSRARLAPCTASTRASRTSPLTCCAAFASA